MANTLDMQEVQPREASIAILSRQCPSPPFGTSEANATRQSCSGHRLYR
jgi:hypothetical protein